MIGSHDIRKHADGASAGIFDVEHLNDSLTSGNSIWSLPTFHFILQSPRYFMCMRGTRKNVHCLLPIIGNKSSITFALGPRVPILKF